MTNMVQEKPNKSTTARTRVAVKATKVLKATTPKRATTRRTAKAPGAAAAAPRTPEHQAIAARAHALYVQSGFAPGRDEEFWLEAERQLLAELNA